MSCSLVLEYVDDDLVDRLQKRKQSLKSAPKASPEAGTSSGNQSDRTRTSPPFKLREAVDIMKQIAIGMQHLHGQGILHGDLKTKNILVTRGGFWNSVKVADFGLVRTKRKSTSFASRQARKLDMARWKAPEILKVLLEKDKGETSSESDSESSYAGSSGETSSKSDSKSSHAPGSSGAVKRRVLDGNEDADVYSFAVTCCQILTGEDPYPNPNWRELMDSIVARELRPTVPAACPSLLRDLLESCWASASHRRRGEAAFSSRPPFSFICRTLELLGRSLSQFPGEEASCLVHLVITVRHSIESIIEETRTASWGLVNNFLTEETCSSECDKLREVLITIIPDIKKIRGILRVTIVYKKLWNFEYLERVKDWLTRLQHVLYLTAIDVHKCHVAHHVSHVAFISRKLSEHRREINELAEQRTNLLSPKEREKDRVTVARSNMFLSNLDELPSYQKVFIRLRSAENIDTISRRIRKNYNLDTSSIQVYNRKGAIIRVSGVLPIGELDFLRIAREGNSGAEILDSSLEMYLDWHIGSNSHLR